MPSYKIKIYPEALNDIQQSTDWYNDQSKGLGIRFQKQVIKQINLLEETAELYSVRYNTIRCMVIKKFPFMLHFTIEGENVIIFALFHTSRNPKIWDKVVKRKVETKLD